MAALFASPSRPLFRSSPSRKKGVACAALFLAVAGSVSGCTKKASTSSGAKGFNDAEHKDSSAVSAPLPRAASRTKFSGTAGNMRVLTPDEEDAIVDAMRETKNAFYLSIDGYDETPGGTKLAPPLSEITTCLSAVPKRWSTLQAHYYCTFPGYAPGYFPSIRECFSYLVSPNVSVTVGGVRTAFDPKDNPNAFEKAYDYCAFSNVDRENNLPTGKLVNWSQISLSLTQPSPGFDKGPAVGPFRWIHKHQEDVYKFVMFGGKCNIDPASTAKILEKFYGEPKYVDLDDCAKP